MDKHSTYAILDDINLVIEYYWNKTTVEDIINQKKSLFAEKLYHPEIEILMDFRDTKLSMKVAALNTYFDFANRHKDFIGKRKVAFLMREPTDVVIGILFDLNQGDLPILTKVFSTLEAAVSWLNVDFREFERINRQLIALSANSN